MLAPSCYCQFKQFVKEWIKEKLNACLWSKPSKHTEAIAQMKIRVCSRPSWLGIQQPSKDSGIMAAWAPLQVHGTEHLTAIAQHAAKSAPCPQNNANITSRCIACSRNTTRSTSRAPVLLVSTHPTLYTNVFPTKLQWRELDVQARLLLVSPHPPAMKWDTFCFKISGLFWSWQDGLGGALGKVRPFLGSMSWESSWRDSVVQYKKMRWINWQK